MEPTTGTAQTIDLEQMMKEQLAQQEAAQSEYDALRDKADAYLCSCAEAHGREGAMDSGLGQRAVCITGHVFLLSVVETLKQHAAELGITENVDLIVYATASGVADDIIRSFSDMVRQTLRAVSGVTPNEVGKKYFGESSSTVGKADTEHHCDGCHAMGEGE